MSLTKPQGITEEWPIARKRRYGEGTIRQRGLTWEIGYRPRPGEKQVWERVGSERDGMDYDAPRQVLLDRLLKIGRGAGGQFLGWRFEQMASDWLARERAKAELSERTLELHETNLNAHPLPAFGETYLHQIDYDAIEDYWIAKVTFAPGEEGAARSRARRRARGRLAFRNVQSSST